MVGFSKLAGSDEERTLARLRALRSDLIDPTIAVHNGRIVKRTGDGVLIEFRSVVDAVRCAIEMQNGMIERNAGLPPERRIEFRVGIHLGNVVEESDGDLMGDSVNIAARLEGIADPGGICLSEDAYRQVRDLVVISDQLPPSRSLAVERKRFPKHLVPLIIENRWLLLLADEQVEPGMWCVQEIEDTRAQIGEAGHAVEDVGHAFEQARRAQRLLRTGY